jgi:hypothetical protein
LTLHSLIRGCSGDPAPAPANRSHDQEHQGDDQQPPQGFDRQTNASQNQGEQDDDYGSGHKFLLYCNPKSVPPMTRFKTVSSKGSADRELQLQDPWRVPPFEIWR